VVTASVFFSGGFLTSWIFYGCVSANAAKIRLGGWIWRLGSLIQHVTE